MRRFQVLFGGLVIFVQRRHDCAAQSSSTGEIRGTVTDPSGAVPGAARRWS